MFGSTDLSSVTNATINVGVIDDFCSSGISQARDLLLRSINTDVEHAIMTNGGTNLGPVGNVVGLDAVCI